MQFKKMAHWIIFPWLIASYPILFLYAENFSLVVDREVLEALALVLVLTTGGVASVWMGTKDKYKGAFFASLVALMFFLYGHLVNVVSFAEETEPTNSLSIIRTVTFAGFILVWVMIFVFIGRRGAAKKLYSATPYLNLVSATLVFFVILQIANAYLKTQEGDSELKIEKPAREVILNDSSDRPDIYYIILDGYPSNSYFLREFGYDNSAFTDELEKRGFFVAYESLSNYGQTLGSLTSSLNMRYLSEEDRLASGDPLAYARWLLANNKTAYDLQELGYKYVYMLSGFASPSDIADINIDFFPRGPRYFETDGLQDNAWFYKQSFWPLVLETTMAYPLADDLVAKRINETRPYGWDEPQRVLDVFNETEKIPLMEEATFSFVHVIKPHIPISFDRDGNIVDEVSNVEYDFFAQLGFINHRALQMIDNILGQSSNPPIIILQGDHGSRLGTVWRGSRDMTYFEILNAYYFPDTGNQVLTSSVTPVNTFRIMFNCYFGTDYELLENRHYNMPDGYDDPFNLVEVDIEAWRRSWED